jgi:hypothetical protein
MRGGRPAAALHALVLTTAAKTPLQQLLKAVSRSVGRQDPKPTSAQINTTNHQRHTHVLDDGQIDAPLQGLTHEQGCDASLSPGRLLQQQEGGHRGRVSQQETVRWLPLNGWPKACA